MIVYDVGSHKMGNTTMTTVAVWSVQIVSVDAEKRTVTARWNGNAERKYFEGDIKRWRENRPMLIRSPMGRARLATREEIKAAKLASPTPEQEG
jgi:hypothetical protein